MLQAACDEVDRLEANVRAVERQLAAVASAMEDVTLLQTVPGVVSHHRRRAGRSLARTARVGPLDAPAALRG